MRSVRASLGQVALLVLLNAFVGGMVGLERTVLPLLAEREFGIASAAAATSFIVAFGVSKAFVNLFAGALADRFGRRRVLLAGWLAGVPVPLVILFAPSWEHIVAANVLLGVNQGLAWSMTLNMKLDHAAPTERGLVVGLNEAAGYTGLAAVALATGLLAASFDLRVAPALLGLALALAGLLLAGRARDSTPESAARGRLGPAFRRGSIGALAPLSFGGLATNLKDGALWGLLPLILLARGFDLALIGLVVAAYPVAWGLGQVFFGPWSDHVGRRGLILAGLAAQAVGVAALALAANEAALLGAALLTGTGTAMAYPTLLARVADVSAAEARATALGVYRFWRDTGYAFGALGAGLAADALGGTVALLGVAAVVGIAALVSMR